MREEDPATFRDAARGAALLIPAILLPLFASSVTTDAPVPIRLPVWLDWGRGLIMMLALLCAIGSCIWACVLLSMPADVRRTLAFRRFAGARRLGFARFGAMPERLGILFAESARSRGAGAAARPEGARRAGRRRGARGSRASGGRLRPGPERAPLYDAQFSLSGRACDPNPRDPDLQIAVATYTGEKGDPKGPRPAFRFLSMRLPRALPHLMIDSRRNGSLRAFLPGAQRLSLEGDFDRHFTVYAPGGYERDALELLTPDVMVCLIDHGRRWDIEVVEDRLIVASSRFRRLSDRSETTALLRFSELVGKELGHQATTYSDPRAARPRSQIAAPGRRLRRRSEIWAMAGGISVFVGLIVVPPLVEWLLDRG